MDGVDRDELFVSLTRPQMLLGVTYGFFVLNMIVATELYLILKSPWAIAAAAVGHCLGWVASLKEPRLFELWLSRVRNCPRVPNYEAWGCNSYRP